QHPHTQPPHTALLQAPPPHPGSTTQGEARAMRNVTPAPAHRRNRADTIKHCAHNGTPDPTPRWDKRTRQEVPGQWQALRASVPHNHTDTPHQCRCNDSPGRNII
ncbi:hypothetical protein ATANTOWER_018985, partial [Ataeniobius toweri]|nr:hypothetical protein [Ataeniobius toweri]